MVDSDAHLLMFMLEFVFKLLVFLACVGITGVCGWLLLMWWQSQKRYVYLICCMQKPETRNNVVNSLLALSLLLHFQQQIISRTDFEAVPCPRETHNVVHSPFRAPLHLDSGFYYFDGQSTLIKCASLSPCNSDHPVPAAAAVVVVDVGPPTNPNKV